MSDTVDDLIKEIAVRNGIAVGRDDPIMILQTINQLLMQDFEKKQQEMLEQFKSELEDLALRWSDDAKEKAEVIINASLNASKNSMENLMRTGANEIVTSLKSEINNALNLVDSPVRNVQRSSILNIVASSIAILAAAIVLWAATHH